MSKKLIYFFALLGSMVFFAPACGDSDPCKDVDCGVNGTCFEGVCVCNVGYEGAGCADEWATKFLGSYLGFDACGLDTFDLTTPAVITRISESEVRISNFSGFNSFINANVNLASSAATSAEVIEFNYTDPAGRKFVGTGTITNNTIKGSYVLNYPPPSTKVDNCTFNYSK